MKLLELQEEQKQILKGMRNKKHLPRTVEKKQDQDSLNLDGIIHEIANLKLYLETDWSSRPKIRGTTVKIKT